MVGAIGILGVRKATAAAFLIVSDFHCSLSKNEVSFWGMIPGRSASHISNPHSHLPASPVGPFQWPSRFWFRSHRNAHGNQNRTFYVLCSPNLRRTMAISFELCDAEFIGRHLTKMLSSPISFIQLWSGYLKPLICG